MTYLISILIPTLIERREVFNQLIDNIHKQIEENNYKEKVEVLSICDDRNLKLSVKRNMLQKMSSGRYFCHIDDDDSLESDFCKSVITHIEDLPIFQKTQPDIIGYNQLAKVNGNRFIVKPNIKNELFLSPVPQSKTNNTGYQEFERFPWQYNLWHEKYKKIYRTESDTKAREDQNWLKKIKLEYPKQMSYIDKILHIYNFDNPELSTCQ